MLNPHSQKIRSISAGQNPIVILPIGQSAKGNSLSNIRMLFLSFRLIQCGWAEEDFP